ncbi:hypothetical protein MLGJGCBP_03556 [Rhodococcus sp. T7]|nr:hypothetical protein MLGJGCBP_09510 [Rhodococcus sp. T7]KAF0963250.1 hypothetical protein MLGJGCBP_03556 [Rhodococcus sp. T7]
MQAVPVSLSSPASHVHPTQLLMRPDPYADVQLATVVRPVL